MHRGSHSACLRMFVGTGSLWLVTALNFITLPFHKTRPGHSACRRQLFEIHVPRMHFPSNGNLLVPIHVCCSWDDCLPSPLDLMSRSPLHLLPMGYLKGCALLLPLLLLCYYQHFHHIFAPPIPAPIFTITSSDNFPRLPIPVKSHDRHRGHSSEGGACSVLPAL